MALKTYYASILSVGKYFENQSEYDSATIEAEDNLFFKSGEVYRIFEEDLPSGVSINSYGTGDNPVIKSSTIVTGWTDEGDGTWSKTMSKPEWVWFDGSLAKQSETDWIRVTNKNNSNTLSISDSDVSGFTSIVGSTAVVKNRRFTLSAPAEVSSYSSGTVTLNRIIRLFNSSYDGGVKFHGLTEFFSASDEWAYEGGKLYVNFDPSTVEITTSNSSYTFKNGGFLNVKNITFSECYGSAIEIGADNVHISNCIFEEIRGEALHALDKYDNIEITNNTIREIGNNGVMLQACDNVTFNDNTVYNIGNQDNFGWITHDIERSGGVFISNGNGCGFTVRISESDSDLEANNHTVLRNTVYNVAMNGISYHIGQNISIKNNTAYNSNLRFTDGSCIYTYNYTGDLIPGSDFVVEENTCYNPVGSDEGIFDPPGDNPVMCIYIDNYTGDAIVRNNTLHTPSNDIGAACLFINNGNVGVLVEDNDIDAGLLGTCIRFNYFSSNAPIASDNLIFRNNTYTGLYAYSYSSNPDSDEMFSSATGNVFNAAGSKFALTGGGDSFSDASLATYQAFFGVDLDIVIQ